MSWVGFYELNDHRYKGIKRGVYSPVDMLSDTTVDNTMAERLNALYAKEYKIYNDFKIVYRGLFVR